MKNLNFLDENGLGIPNITVNSDTGESQTTDSNGLVSFADGKQVLTVDENTSPPTAVASVVTNFMIKSIS